MTRTRPIILGIVGDSAAGKSTITQGLSNILGAERVTHVCAGDYHKYDRKERAQHGITALHPDLGYLVDDPYQGPTGIRLKLGREDRPRSTF